MSKFTRNAAYLLATCVALAGLMESAVQAGSLHWETDYAKAKKQAVAESKPMLIMFTASWCGPCKKMKSSTLSNSKIEQEIEANFIPVMIDTDDNPSVTRKFGVNAMPTIAVVDPTTEESEKVRGYQGTSEFLSFLDNNKSEINLASATEYVMEEGNGEVLADDCLVSAIEDHKLVDGNKQFSSSHNGYVVYFASAENKQKFDKNPEKFWPELSGNCPVHLAETGKLTRGQVRWVVAFNNKLYMCDSESHANKFVQSPAKFISAAITKISAKGSDAARR
ncbi:thioredoxin domain-containing protein [Rubinisphaera sp.]|uniref:thioredoxin domain-containing protein n=1 Tax=Rubinisphaera sp. TaxID=2024857 RepID=UPI000C10E8C9|nr:thioredoxin domain-containing protein [Rubinisphaera sp.]MBV11505.1 hypothetical protein [Rubinisphaera sp.]HCS52934.1 hypothetical protein [Planctomycetaceae bacterium]|tara:strand:+ start:6076 stop:6912 length:837 start_codon:yes stop_codon:yes gene_type:complete